MTDLRTTSGGSRSVAGLVLGALLLGRRVRRRARLVASLAVIASLGSVASPASAQVYLSSRTASTFVPLQNGVALDFHGDPDEGVALVPLPFPFTHYGVTYSHVNAAVNGAITFAGACASVAECAADNETCNAQGLCEASGIPWDRQGGVPNIETPNALVAAFWDDLFASGLVPETSISAETIGSAPDRELVIEWRNVRHYRSSRSSTSFQIRLREAGGLRIQYGPYLADAGDDVDWTGYIGIENRDGTEGVAPLPCVAFAGTCDFTDLQDLADEAIDFFVPTRPELVVSATSPEGALPGATFPVELEIRNLGTVATAGPVLARVYLSADEEISAVDAVLGAATAPALAPGASARVTVSAVLDVAAALGAYRLGAFVDPDGAEAEAIETNNTYVVAAPFLVGPDLAAGIDAVADGATQAPFEVPVHVLSLGAPVASTTYAIHLSSDSTYDAGDLELARGTIALVGDKGADARVSVTVPSGVPPGDYFFVVRVDADGVLTEADETNNVAVTLEPTSLAGPDVVAADLLGDGRIFAAQPYVVTSLLRNTGAGTAVSFFYGVYLSDNSAITLSDRQLGRFGPISLAPGEERRLTEVVTVPAGLAEGAYFLGLLADIDSTVPERQEANNIHARAIQLVSPASDFTVEGITPPEEVAAGEIFPIERVIRNIGVSGGEIEYAIFLSEDAVIDPETDVELGWGAAGLGPRSEDRQVDHVRVPGAVLRGAYYLGYVLDLEHEVRELEEDNNIVLAVAAVEVLPSALVVVTQAIPGAIVDVPFDFTLAAAGGTGPYTWRVRSGELPIGLVLDGAGRISGTPSSEARSTVVVGLSDGSTETTRSFEVVATETSIELSVATAFLVPGFVDRPYAYPLTALGGAPPYTWVADRELPAGLELTGDGVLRGVPLAPALAPINFQVRDALGGQAERPLVVRVVNANASVRFALDVLPDGSIGEPYDEDLRVVPGTGESPFVFSVASGRLPPGLELVGDRVQGAPLSPGVFPVEIRVSDARGDVDRNLFLITVGEALGVAITTTSLPPATVGVPYVDAAGEPVVIRGFSTGRPDAPVRFSLSSRDTLPPGLELAEDGALVGVPTAAGAFPFLVLAEDDVRQRDQRALGILVQDPAADLPASVADEGCGCSTSASPRGAGLFALMFAVLLVLRAGGRRSLVVLAVVSTAGTAEAQTASYRVMTRTEPYVTKAGGATVPFASYDESSQRLALPFPFEFFGESYQDVLIGTNGAILFGDDTQIPALNGVVPSASGPNGIIAPAWDDLVSRDVRTFVDGAAPRRVFTIQYTGSRPFIGNGDLSFQIRLFEGAGPNLEVHYGPLSPVLDVEWSASSGFESGDGRFGQPLLACASACTGRDLAAAEDTIYSAFLDTGLDVMPSELGAPEVVYAGRAFEPTVVFTSLHEANIGPFRYDLELVVEGQASRGRVVFSSAPITLAPYEVRTDRPSVVVPEDLAPGRYQLLVVGDSVGEVMEPDESNNLLVAGGVVRVSVPVPNFRAGSVTTSTGSAAPGDALEVTAELENAGNLDGEVTYSVRLSRNARVTADDLEVGAFVAPLAAGERRTVRATVNTPASLPPGPYFVGVVLDPADAVRESSELDNSEVSARPIRFATGALEIVARSLPLPLAHVGVPYSARVVALGGDGAFAWQVTEGALPDGLNLVPSTGEIRGVPRSAGTARVTVEVESARVRTTAPLELTVSVLDTGLTIATRELLPGIVGESYPPLPPGADPSTAQKILVAGASGPVSIRAIGTLPAGIVLDEDGSLRGRPTVRGAFEVRVRASDGVAEAERTLILTIAEPGRLTLVAAVLYPVVEAEFTYRLQAIGRAGTATLAFSTEDPLPRGLSLTADGYLGGVAQAIESRLVAVTVVEGSIRDPAAARDTALILVSVVPDGRLVLSPATLPIARVGAPYEATLTAEGGAPGVTWQVTGEMPAGMSFTTERRGDRDVLVFQGVPEAEDFRPLQIGAIDELGRSATAAFVLQVALTLPAPVEDEGCGCSTSEPRGDQGAAHLVALVLVGLLARRRRGAIAALLAGLAACGGSSDLEPRLSVLEREVFAQSCTFSSCHGPAGVGAELVLTSPSYDRIVGVESSAVAGRILVVPGDPGASYLLEKLEDADPAKGDRMPLGAPALDPDLLAALRTWIEKGAPAD